MRESWQLYPAFLSISVVILQYVQQAWARTWKMVRKCCVGNCKSNYDTESEYVSLHMFPSDKDERQRCFDALPNVVTKVTKNTVVCVKHWPLKYQTCMKKGNVRPARYFLLPSFLCPKTSLKGDV